jgi:hypothetical protein
VYGLERDYEEALKVIKTAIRGNIEVARPPDFTTDVLHPGVLPLLHKPPEQYEIVTATPPVSYYYIPLFFVTLV